MALNIETGLRAAKLQARSSDVLYIQATKKYGRLIETYRGALARSVGVGHLLRVNSQLEDAPPITKDRRRGFLRATVGMANTAQIAWDKLDDPTICAYVWGRDINEDGRALYRENQTLFTSPNTDFWKCAYLKHVLGNTAFNIIWDARDKSQSLVYDGLLYAVNERSKSLPGWPIIQLKRTVLLECVFVFEIAKRGGSITTSSFGIQPVLHKTAMQQVYN